MLRRNPGTDAKRRHGDALGPGARNRYQHPGEAEKPVPQPATYHRTHGIRCLHGCYSMGGDQLWGVTRRHKGADHTLAGLRSIRAAQPGGCRLFVILDDLSANKNSRRSAAGPSGPVWSCAYAGERVLCQPDRSAIRSVTRLCHGRF
jgi:hypothetical protein